MGKILGYLRIVILSLLLVIFVFLLVPCHLVFRFSRETLFRIRTFFCRITFFILGIRIGKEGQPIFTHQPALIVCNHRSLLDPFICARYIHGFYLSKAEIRKYPVFGYGSDLTGAIFVERENKESRGATRRAIADTLKAGYNVLLFPEGTTCGEETTKQFYKGSFEVAHEVGVPVVPVVVEYKNRDHYWVDGGVMAKSVEQFSGIFMDLHIWIGDPVQQSTAMETLAVCQRLMNEKILEIHRDWGNIKA